MFMGTHVSNDRIPASFVVDHVTVARRVNNVELKTHAVLDDGWQRRILISLIPSSYGASLTLLRRHNLGRLTNRLIDLMPSLGIDQMRCKQRVDQRRFSQTSLSNDHHIELKATLQELVLDLAGDGWKGMGCVSRCDM